MNILKNFKKIFAWKYRAMPSFNERPNLPLSDSPAAKPVEERPIRRKTPCRYKTRHYIIDEVAPQMLKMKKRVGKELGKKPNEAVHFGNSISSKPRVGCRCGVNGEMVKLFISECCEYNSKDIEAGMDLYKRYLKWCQVTGVKPIKSRGMYKFIDHTKTISIRVKIEGGEFRMYKGIKIVR